MKFWTGLALCGGLIAGCTAADDRVLFDGQFFRTKLRKVERQFDTFTVAVSPVSRSLKGAREAGEYEAVSYCVRQFGSSDVIWAAGPDAPDSDLSITKDTLLLQGKCPNGR